MATSSSLFLLANREVDTVPPSIACHNPAHFIAPRAIGGSSTLTIPPPLSQIHNHNVYHTTPCLPFSSSTVSVDILDLVTGRKRKKYIDSVSSIPGSNSNSNSNSSSPIHTSFHDVNYTDWELGIQWSSSAPLPPPPGFGPNSHSSRITPQNVVSQFLASSSPSASTKLHLYQGDPTIAPLATSILKTLLAPPSNNPLPFKSSVGYLNRVEADRRTEERRVKVNSQNMQNRRASRREMLEQEKAKRIKSAYDGMDLGGGKAFTVTSSIMGEGGQVRTGRTSKSDGFIVDDRVGYVDHQPFAANHNFSKSDLSRSSLRQFHRPRLAKSGVRPDRKWQMCLSKSLDEFSLRGGNGNGNGNGNGSSTADKQDLNNKPPADSFEDLLGGFDDDDAQLFRDKKQLHVAQGELVLFEYLEERPPLILNKGMSSNIKNYFRGKVSVRAKRSGPDRSEQQAKRKKITLPVV